MNSDSLLLIALNLMAKATLVLCLGFAVIGLMRKGSAAWRALVWLQVFAVLAVLPGFALMRPVWSWQMPMLGAAQEKKMVGLAEPFSGVSGAMSSVVPKDPFAPFPEEVEKVELVGEVRWVVGDWLVMGYLVVAVLLLLYRLFGCWQLRSLKREDADAVAMEFVKRLVGEHRLRRRIRFYQSPQVVVPMTWGVFRPVLVLPSSSVGWSDEEKEAAVRHEFAHILHWDAAKRWLCAIVGAVFWVHPLVWLAARRWKLEQECACDDFVIGSGLDATAYARQLLAAAKTFRAGLGATAAALVMAMPSGLEVRVKAVVDGQVRRMKPGIWGRFGTAMAGMLAMAFGVSIQAQVKEVVPDGVDSAGENRQFVVKTQFIEINGLDNLDTLEHSLLKDAAHGEEVKLDASTMEKLLAQLAQKKGVHLMTAPSLTARNGQPDGVEVVREFLYPTEFEWVKERLTPTTFEMEQIGARVGIDGRLHGQDSLQLKLNARVTQFDGFTLCREKDLLGKSGGIWAMDFEKDYSTHHLFRQVDQGSPMLRLGKNYLSYLNEGEGRDALNRGEVLIPSFSSMTWVGEAKLKLGECRVGYLKQTKGNPKWHRGQHLWCLVSLVEISPDLGPAPKVDEQAEVAIEAKFITLSWANGELLEGKEWITRAAFGEPNDYVVSTLSSREAAKLVKGLGGKVGVKVHSSIRMVVPVLTLGVWVEHPVNFSADGAPVANSAKRKVGTGVAVSAEAFDNGVIKLKLAPSQTTLLGWRIAGREELLKEEPKGLGPYEAVFETTDRPSTSASLRDGETVLQTLGRGAKGEGRLRLIKATIVPPANRAKEKTVTVLGDVWRQGKYGFEDALTVARALEMAKGARKLPGALKATITRGKEEDVKELVVEAEAMGTTEVKDGDVVRIWRL